MPKELKKMRFRKISDTTLKKNESALGSATSFVSPAKENETSGDLETWKKKKEYEEEQKAREAENDKKIAADVTHLPKKSELDMIFEGPSA